jgi:hypothetical protein
LNGFEHRLRFSRGQRQEGTGCPPAQGFITKTMFEESFITQNPTGAQGSAGPRIDRIPFLETRNQDFNPKVIGF